MFVSLTLTRYKKRAVPLAFLSMVVFRLPLWLNKKCSFHKLMGCGKNGTFDKNPDWQQWALLAVWPSEADFNTFISDSFLVKWWKIFALEQYTILCEPLESHGKWSGKEPFLSPGISGYTGPVAVLTRAQIRLSRLKNFWANVPAVAAMMKDAPGLVFSVGVGEAPLYLQATFSVWHSMDDVKNFAYRQREHADVIKKTRREDWYAEELFARFKLVKTIGTLQGNNPLADIIN